MVGAILSQPRCALRECPWSLLTLRKAIIQLSSAMCVSDIEATAIRTVFDQDGELSAAVELRRFFPGIPRDKVRFWARVIAGWQELEIKPLPVARRRLSVW
jgi:hypothetical protein